MKTTPLIILLILGALTTVSPFSIDMYLPAFQQIASQFHISTSRVSLSLSSYFVGLAFGQVFYGPFLDRFGRKPPLFIGLGIYILASFACALSPTIECLIVFRFFQALGGCAAGVASMAMVRDFYPVEESARVFSNLMLILSVSPLFAPTIGSLVSTTYGWQAVFISLAFIAILVTLSVWFFLPEGHTPDESIQLDPLSIFASLSSIFKDSQFSTYALSGAFSFAGLFGYLAGSSAIFMGSFHLGARLFGGIFAFLSVGIVGGGQINIFLSRWFKAEQVFKTAIFSQLVIAILFSFGSYFEYLNLYAHILILFLYLSCLGLTYPNAASLALAPFKKNAGSAAALLGFLQMVIGAIASAVFGLLNLGASFSVSILFSATSLFGVLILEYKRNRRSEI